MIDINLLPQQNVSSIEENRIRKFSLFGVVGFSAIWVLLLGGLFYYDSALMSQFDKLSQQKISLQDRLDEQSDLVDKLLVLKKKIAGIGYIQKSRFNLPSGLRYVFNLFPSEITVSKITADGAGFVTMDLKGTDSKVVADFVSSMGRDTVLKTPTLAAFSMTDEGGYVFTISAQYGEKLGKPINN